LSGQRYEAIDPSSTHRCSLWVCKLLFSFLLYCTSLLVVL